MPLSANQPPLLELDYQMVCRNVTDGQMAL
jgi:hypothetical protein